MITPKEFSDKWNSDVFPLIDYDIANINSLALSKETKNFLIETGLPESAASFLNYESSSKWGSTGLTEKFGLNSYDKMYIYLGFTGTGDLICVDEKSGEVLSLDHENEKNNMFINSSIPQLAECLLEYSEFLKKIKAIHGRIAFLERNAT